MTSLRLHLDAINEERLSFEGRECKTIEVWSTDTGFSCQERDMQPTEIVSWIGQTEKFLTSNDTTAKCHLRLIYQEWEQSEDMRSMKKIPFAKDVFKRMSEAFGLATEYLHLFTQNKYTPLYVALPNSENELVRIMFQSPNFANFTTLALSYDPKTGTTRGFLGFKRNEANDNLISLLKCSAADASHPLLLPTILVQSWISEFSSQNTNQYYHVQEVKKVTAKMSAPGLGSNAFVEFDKAQEIIMDIHNTINNSMAPFVTTLTANLHEALRKVSGIATNPQASSAMRQSQKDFVALLPAWRIAVNCEVDVRARFRERLGMQLQLLNNMMQREESKRMKESADDSKRIAESSNRIAEDARNDSKAMKAISEQSKRIAEFTQLDSSAMKTIAAVTMVFLPGTAIATIFSMNPFFEVGSEGEVVASPQFWIYWLVTTPVTCLVFGAWWSWNQREHKRIRKINEKQSEEDGITM